MRWDSLRLADDPAVQVGAPRPLLPRGAVTRTFDTPEFRGLTFHEVTCRSALNKVPDASPVPFRWTINPYRGCSMSCVYCFARKTHEYLDLDSGTDFDTQIVVKTNVGEVLRRGLLPADARHHPGPHRGRQPVLDPHQGRADPARPGPAHPRRRGGRRVGG